MRSWNSGHVLLVVLHGDVCHSIVVNDAVVAVTEVPDLFSDHEESDTRLLLHVHQDARVFSSVTIKSPDKYLDYITWWMYILSHFGRSYCVFQIHTTFLWSIQFK